jgi:hypothetical protein
MTAFDSLGGTAFSTNEYFARLVDGQQTELHAFPWYFGPNGASVVASDDLSHVFADVPEPIDPSHQPSTPAAENYNVYDFGSGTPELVSRLPGAGGVAPVCGVVPVPNDPTTTPFGFATATGSEEQHWTSTDGTRVFFVAANDAPACSSYQLYMRDLNAQATTLISGPPIGSDTDHGVDRFLSASADGTQVYFRTATSLDPADDTDGDANDMDIYRWSAGQSTCLTCGVPQADVSTVGSGHANAVVSADGSHLYFTSPSQLADAPSAGSVGAPNLYVLQPGHTSPHFIGQVNGVGVTPVFEGSQVTPDGNTLIFLSNQPGLNAISASDNGGFLQLYRYSDGDGSVTCVSCPSGGPAGNDVTFLAGSERAVQARNRAVTDDGSMVFFTTSDTLVPEDVNGTHDIYEWHDGAVRLITNGVTSYPGFTEPDVASVSADGHDVFFVDPAQLTADARDGVGKLYDARIDGGFPPPASPPPPCDGDTCHGPPSTAPDLPDPGSTTESNPGNVVPGSLTVGRISAAQRAKLVKSGAIALSVTVNMAGRVSAIAQTTIGKRVRVVARASTSATKAGTLRVTLRLSKAARAQLSTHGRMQLVLAVTFAKAPAAKRLTLSLRAASREKHRARRAAVHATAHGR